MKISGIFEYKGYFKIEIDDENIPRFLEKIFTFLSKDMVEIDFKTTSPDLKKPYFLVLPSKKRKKLQSIETLIKVEKLSSLLKKLFSSFGVYGFLLKSDGIKIKICDDHSIEILVPENEKNQISKFLKNILTGKPTKHWKKIYDKRWKEQFPINGTFSRKKNIFYVYTEVEDIPKVITEVLKRMKIKRCEVDIKGPNTSEFERSYIKEMKYSYKRIITNEELNEKFKRLGLEFKNFRAQISVKNLYKFLTWDGIFGTDVLIASKKLLARQVHDDGVAIFFVKKSFRDEIEKTLKKILTLTPSPMWKVLWEKKKNLKKRYIPFFWVIEEKREK